MSDTHARSTAASQQSAVHSTLGNSRAGPSGRMVLFNSDDEDVEITYDGSAGGPMKKKCVSSELWHARVADMRIHNGEVSMHLPY